MRSSPPPPPHQPSGPGGPPPVDTAARIHWWVVSVLQATLSVGLVLAAARGQWLNVATMAAILLLMFVPTFLFRRWRVHIPPEFELMAIVFVYASLFLGEVRNYYERFWWWDLLLHTGSGLLLGIVGFLLVYILNESDRIDLHMRPRFVALFAFCFAVMVGALWEIFEFAMDELAGMNMQKPMFNDPSGLTDTMWDLIVDTLGAAAISGAGWWYMARGRPSFVEAWIRKFIDHNPRLFRRRGDAPR